LTFIVCHTWTLSHVGPFPSLNRAASAELAASADEVALRAWNTKYFGKDGEIPTALKRVGSVPPDERKSYGQNANRIKETLSTAYNAALSSAKERALEQSLATEKLDVSLPGRPTPAGDCILRHVR
jgi:phenylalanyl-tRNA synthetase alpha chain